MKLLYLLLISAVVNYFPNVQMTFIHHELNGQLKDSEMDFSVFLMTTKGILFYSLDSTDELLMKLEDNNESIVFIIFCNNIKIIKTPKGLCSCSKCEKIHLHINLNKMKLNIKCNNHSTNLMLRCRQNINTGRSPKYPIPKNYYKAKNKTYIWMGNIGPYDGYDKSYFPIKDQLVGCVNYFHFDKQKIQMENHGDRFLSSCIIKSLNETKCNKNNCSNKQIPVHMYDCSMRVINQKYCSQIHFLIYNATNQSYITYGVNHKIYSLKLSIKVKEYNDYCIMELTLRKPQLNMIISIDKLDQVIMTYSDKTLLESTAILWDKIHLNTILTLSITYNDSDFSIKISDGYSIRIFNIEFNGELEWIHIGKSYTSRLCSLFKGEYSFKYNISQFRKNTPKNQRNQKLLKESKRTLKIWMVLGIIFLVFCVFIATYFFIKIQLKKSKQSGPENSSTNVQKPLIENENDPYSEIHDFNLLYETIIDIDFNQQP